MQKIIGEAEFVCLRHDGVPGKRGPFRTPILHQPKWEGRLGQPYIRCPVCGRRYFLVPGTLCFYADRPLKLLSLELHEDS